MTRVCSAVLHGLAAFLIIVGTISLVYSQKITDRGVLSLHSLRYRSDFVFLAAVGVAVVSWALAQPSKRLRLTKGEVFALVSIALYLASCFSATVLARVEYGLWFDLVGFTNLAKTLLGLALSLVVYVYLRDNASLYRALVWALVLPPFVPVALGIFLHLWQSRHPEIGKILHVALGDGCYELGDAVCGSRVPLLAYGERFQGLTANPVQLSFGLITALSFLWPLTMLYAYRRRWTCCAVALVCAECLIAGLFWTEVRSALVALVLVLGFGAILMHRHVKVGAVHYAGAASVALILLAGAWSLLPPDTATALAARFETSRPQTSSLPPPGSPSSGTASAPAPIKPPATPVAPALPSRVAASRAPSSPSAISAALAWLFARLPRIATPAQPRHPTVTAPAPVSPRPATPARKPTSTSPVAGAVAVRVSPIPVGAGPDASEESVSSNYGRLAVWKYYAVVAAHNILGIGFNYDQRFYAINVHNERVTAHNNVLMTWMFGGAVATLGVVMLWWQLLRSMVTGLRSETDAEAFVVYLGVSGAFASMWLLSATIGNLIGEFTFAILMAMVLAGPPRPREGAAKPLVGGLL